MKYPIIIISLCVVLLIIRCGCTSSEFNNVHNTIEEHIYPAKTKTQFKMRIGSVLLFPVKVIVSLIDTKGEVSPFLDEVHEVQFGIYEIEEERKSAGWLQTTLLIYIYVPVAVL